MRHAGGSSPTPTPTLVRVQDEREARARKSTPSARRASIASDALERDPARQPQLAGSIIGGVGAAGLAQNGPSAKRRHTRPGAHGVRGSHGIAHDPSTQAPDAHVASPVQLAPAGESVTTQRDGVLAVSQVALAPQSTSASQSMVQYIAPGSPTHVAVRMQSLSSRHGSSRSPRAPGVQRPASQRNAETGQPPSFSQVCVQSVVVLAASTVAHMPLVHWLASSQISPSARPVGFELDPTQKPHASAPVVPSSAEQTSPRGHAPTPETHGVVQMRPSPKAVQRSDAHSVSSVQAVPLAPAPAPPGAHAPSHPAIERQ